MPVHVKAAPTVTSFKFDQINFNATYSGFVPYSEYGHVELVVSPDPSSIFYIQLMAKLPVGAPAWVVRNLPILEGATYGVASVQTSVTVDLTQLNVTRGANINAMNIYYSTTLTTSPISSAPSFSPTLSTIVGERIDNAQGRLPTPPVFSGRLAISTPPPAFAFADGPQTRVFRRGMGSVVQGPNECAPGGVANSMQWLANSGFINLRGETPGQSLQKLKSDMKPGGWTGTGASDRQAIEGKLRFAQRAEHPLDLIIGYQADSGLTDLGNSVTVGSMTANRDGNGGPPTWEYLKAQMLHGEDVELALGWLNDTGQETGGHVVAVSGLIERGNYRAILFNDDEKQNGAADGLRINHKAEIQAEGAYMRLGGLARNRIEAIYVESPAIVVGGIVVPIDKLGLLAPYVGLASTMIIGAVASAVYVKRVKRRKEKQ
jgi:hypothetical protein